MINNYIKMICGMLSLPMPQVFYNDSALLPDEHARLTPDGKRLYLRKLKAASLDQLFAAAAELRREWQRRTDNELYFGSYRPREELSLREFSLQPSEVDANAFGAVVVLAFFGVDPVFDELPGVARSRIEARAEEIRKTEFPDLAKMAPH
ncbi:MAG: hypothetical protein SPD47_11065 [Oscillospiraceae bacterium]|nr:hypothetical protein [Oscillospiraceae bacterium]